MRSLRRYHLERMKKKAIRAYHWKTPEEARKLANHLCMCSCHMCGNPRRYWGTLTIQERKYETSRF